MGFADFPFRCRYLEVGRHRLRYLDHGEGPALVFLHGNGSNIYIWRNILNALSDHYRCIALDLPGFGYSDTPLPPLDLDQQQQVLTDFLDQLGLSQVTLVGHDWGGVLAMQLAQQQPQRVHGLCLMESFPFTFDWGELPLLLRPLLFALRRPGLGELLLVQQPLLLRALLPFTGLRRLPGSVRAAYRAPLRGKSQRATLLYWLRQLPINDHPHHTWQQIKALELQLHQLQTPLLLLEFDPGVFIGPTRLHWFRQQLPTVDIKHCGRGLHYVQEDSPSAIAVALKEWLPGLRPGVQASSATSKIAESRDYRGELQWHWSAQHGLPLLAAWSDQGLIHYSVVDNREQALAELAQRFPNAQLSATEKPVPAPSSATSPALHLCGSEFQCQVWRALLQIAPGETRHYGQIAVQLGSQARAIGQAVGRNRIAFFIPCHRVIRADGSLGGYHWGLALKKAFLAQESTP